MTYPTQTAQKRDLDSLNRKYSQFCRNVRNLALQDRDAGFDGWEALYDLLPFELHQVRPHHIDALAERGLDAFSHTLAKKVERRSEIKAAAIAPKAPTKSEEAQKRVERKLQENPTLVQAFQGPVRQKLREEVARQIGDRISALVNAYGLSPDWAHMDKLIRLTTVERDRERIRRDIADHKRFVRSGVIDALAIITAVDEVVDAEIEATLPKMVLKLGRAQVSKVDMQRGGAVHILAHLDGHEVRVEQQRILKVSPLGRLFCQWPSRVYVDGQFTPEAAYAKMAD